MVDIAKIWAPLIEAFAQFMSHHTSPLWYLHTGRFGRVV